MNTKITIPATFILFAAIFVGCEKEGPVLTGGDDSTRLKELTHTLYFSNGDIVETHVTGGDGVVAECRFEYYEDDNPFYGEIVDGVFLSGGTYLPGVMWSLGQCGMHNRKLLKSLTCETGFGNYQEWRYSFDEQGRLASFIKVSESSDIYHVGTFSY